MLVPNSANTKDEGIDHKQAPEISFINFIITIICLFVCLGSATAFFPRGQLPKEDLRRPPSTTQATRHPRALCQCLFPLPPYFCLECLLHPVCTLPCPPVLYIYPIESLVCFPVLHIYSKPTEKNPSTYFKPHKQTMLIHYLNKRNNYNISEPLISSPLLYPPCLPVRCPSLTPPTFFPFAI